MARLSDILRGAGHRNAPAWEVHPASHRLSDLVRRPTESAPPFDADTSAAASSPGSGLADLQGADELLQRTLGVVEGILDAVKQAVPFSVADAETMVEALLKNLEASDVLLLPFFAGRDPSPSAAREAANVCILSVKIGLELGYGAEELRELGLAALLCDVGMARVPPEVLHKRGPLNPAERELLQAHQREGATLLQQLGPDYAWLAETVARRYGMAEGPRHPEDKTEEHAAIIRLADVYESLVHHRPFRQPIGPLEALGEILRRERAAFPDRILKALIEALSTFPVGSLVRLNTGEIGRVVKQNKDIPLRPVVEVFVRRGKRLEQPAVIDLRHSPLRYIEDSVAEEAFL